MDSSVCREARHHKRSLSVAWIDYTKAYDHVPHEWILEVIKSIGMQTIEVGDMSLPGDKVFCTAGRGNPYTYHRFSNLTWWPLEKDCCTCMCLDCKEYVTCIRKSAERQKVGISKKFLSYLLALRCPKIPCSNYQCYS